MFSASPDATIRIWSVPNASCVQVVRAHESSVTGLSLHATGDYLLSSSDDQVWSQPGPLIGQLVPELESPGRRGHLTNASQFLRTPRRMFSLCQEELASQGFAKLGSLPGLCLSEGPPLSYWLCCLYFFFFSSTGPSLTSRQGVYSPR